MPSTITSSNDFIVSEKKLKTVQSDIDGLTIFAFLWANIGVLQCVKHYHTVKGHFFSATAAFDQFTFFLLVISVIFATLQPHRSSSLVSLCFSHVLSLVHHGSQSNHVIMAILIASAVLLAYSADRQAWQRKVSGSTYLILIVLYFVSWTHKLNKNWFDRNFSCASLFASGALSMIMPVPANPASSSPFADFVIATSPILAVFVEIFLPTLLIAWRFVDKFSSGLVFKIIMVTGAIFHLMICLPLPPMSAYPFSMVMVPMYVLLLPKESFQLIQALTENLFVLAGIVALFSVSIQYGVLAVLGDESMPLEYPAYGLWTISLIWNIVVWVFILYAAFGIKVPYSSLNYRTFTFSRGGVGVAAVLFLIGMCPYLGVRNYPALAMFSNLITEGNAGNHLILPPFAIVDYPQDTVRIHSTNLKSLENFQVNLGLYFSKRTQMFNTAYGVSNEFWIAPPSWTAPDDRVVPFVPYSIPVIEFRKHLSTHIAKDFYVNFTRNSDSIPSMFISTDPSSVEIHGDLAAPVSWLQRLVFRFRSFDASYSPCRH